MCPHWVMGGMLPFSKFVSIAIRSEVPHLRVRYIVFPTYRSYFFRLTSQFARLRFSLGTPACAGFETVRRGNMAQVWHNALRHVLDARNGWIFYRSAQVPSIA